MKFEISLMQRHMHHILPYNYPKIELQYHEQKVIL